MAWWVWQWWRGWRAWCAALSQPRRFVRTPAASRRKPEWVVTEVLRLKVHLGSQGCRRVADTFNRLHSQRGTTIGKTFVAECLAAHQYALACMRQEMRSRLPRPVAINAIWAMDLTFYADTTGKQQMALGILDHGSRLITCLSTLVNKRSWTLLGYLCLAIGTYGKPRRIRTDNEIIFTSWVFTTLLRLVGIRHQRIQTCAPWQNGRIERLFGTLKPLLRQLVIPSKAALQRALQEFTLFYNHARPHQNLAGLTPAQAWNEWSKTDLAQMPPQRAVLVQALDGLMVGYCMRR